MYNLRYHLASLVAVFLALSVGLVLGTVVVERGTLTTQREALVESLEDEFDQMRADNDELRVGIEQDRAFAAEVLPLLVAGRLEGRSVAVIGTIGGGDGRVQVVDAVRSAGATPVVLTFQVPACGVDQPAIASALTSLLGGGSAETTPADATAVEAAIAEAVARELSSAGPRPVMDELVAGGQLTVEGVDASGTVDAVVLTANWDGEADSFAQAIALRSSSFGLPVCAVSSGGIGRPYLAAASEAGLSAVDHIDRPQGIVSLVWVLRGQAEGYFGLGEDAPAPYPDLTP